jgi:hypothetical protein
LPFSSVLRPYLVILAIHLSLWYDTKIRKKEKWKEGERERELEKAG